MTDVDLPNLDKQVTDLPKDMREDIAELGKRDLMLFGQGILQYKDMTVGCHGPLCTFVTGNKSQFKVILMPRDHFKTSVVTVAGNLQKVVQNPEERILIANESATNAERFLRAIRQHAEGNRIFRSLYSSVIPKDTRKVRWNDSELDFNRQGFYPEPTFDTIGMTGGVTSRHYTHMCFDDPISEEAVKSELVMNDVISRMGSLTALLVKPDYNTVWLVGTRWALHDVYSWYEKTFKTRLSRFARSVIEQGEIIFPELITPEILAIKRTAMGEYRYSCLMMNSPRNAEIQDLNVDDLKFFRWIHDGRAVELLHRDGTVHERWNIDDLYVTCTVDPAPAERIASDRNAIAVVGVTPHNEIVVLESWAQRCTPLELIEKLMEVKQKYNVARFGIEGVAYQKALKYFVKQEAERRGLYLRVQELTAKGKKEIRIRGLQPIMAIGRMYVDPTAHILRNEISEFPLGEHDDALDALSMQLQLLKGRLSPEHLAELDKNSKLMLADVRKARAIESLDLDPDEEIDEDFSDYLPQNWQEVYS